MALPPFKLALPRPLYDPVIDSLVKVVDADAYMAAVNELIRLRNDSRRGIVPTLREPVAGAKDPCKPLRDVAKRLRDRLDIAEAQLWFHSDGRASYFDQYTDAQPASSLREL